MIISKWGINLDLQSESPLLVRKQLVCVLPTRQKWWTVTVTVLSIGRCALTGLVLSTSESGGEGFLRRSVVLVVRNRCSHR